MASRPLSLGVERLERRDTPAIWNTPWPDPQALTLSFAGDGTSVYGANSSLNALLTASAGSVPAGQLEILRAYQTWASVSNVNIGIVADANGAFGLPGPLQGDPSVGDLRIGARPIGTPELAVATPFDLFGTGAGDILFNTQYNFSVGGTDGSYDLYTVALQETGHTLGIPNSSDTGSVMYTYYVAGARTGLGTGDAVAVQSLYGTRSPDRYDANNSNGSISSASSLSYSAGTLTSLAVLGDLTTATDVDFYRVQVPSGQSTLAVQLRTSGVSLTQTRLSVVDASGNVLASITAVDPRTGDLSLTVPATPGTYYIKVEAAPGAGVFGIGAYRLAAGPQSQAVLYPNTGVTYLQQEAHTDDTISRARDTGVKLTGDSHWQLIQRASISDGTDKDVYKFQVDHNAPPVLIASAWGTTAGSLHPSLRLLDKYGNAIATSTLANDGRTFVLQYANIHDGTYYLEVSGAGTTGNYFLGSELRATPITFTGYSFALSQIGHDQVFQLDVSKDRLYHFVLTAGMAAGVEAAVRVTLYDALNNVIGTVVAQEGQTVSLDWMLGTGTYYYKVSGGTRTGAALPLLGYTLGFATRNDPIGPSILDPTLNPGATSGAPDIDDIFATYLPWLNWLDAYSDPFSSL